MKRFDVAIIGGGILGCFAARNLMRYRLSVVLLEAKEDVCTGITRANAAIVYPGYDNRPGSRKAAMTVQGNAAFTKLCEELNVHFSRCGSLMLSYSQQADQALECKYQAGLSNQVPGLTLLSGEEAREREPMAAPGISKALYAPSTGTVNPWQLGIAACENARCQGCEVWLSAPVKRILPEKTGYILQTDREELACSMVLNCAGAAADWIQELVFPPSVRLFPDGADFLILDSMAKKPAHILFHQGNQGSKGMTAVPTVEGTLLLGPTRRPLAKSPYATTLEGLAALREDVSKFLPDIQWDRVIRSFAGVRPNPHRVVFQDGGYVPDGKSLGDFVIEQPAPNFISLMGIKTPGITCADGLGAMLAWKTAEYLHAKENPDFSPIRSGIPKPEGKEIVCLCQQITKEEILEAIRRGAVTVDGVKRRLGTGMGRCQGSRCSYAIEKLLEESTHGTH